MSKSVSIYKPNTRMTGAAINFYISRDNSIMLSMLRQTGPIDSRPFYASKDDPTKKVTVKFSAIECGALLRTIQRGIPAGGEKGLYHSTDKAKTSITFKPYLDKTTGEDRGFSLITSRENAGDSVNKVSVLIGITHAEAAVIEEFLKIAIQTSFEKATEDKAQSEQPAQIKATPAPKVVELGSDIDF